MSFKIGGFQKTSFIDYPEKIAAIVFTQGCNFRCGYCHNPELVNCENPIFEPENVLTFLSKRTKLLDAVVISGGEPTLQTSLPEFCSKVKELGYLIKLDTNGTHFNILKSLIDTNLVDYVAMDIKAPLLKYFDITNVKIDIEQIGKSISYLLKDKIDYEFRTTVVKEQLSFEDFENISQLICGAKKYYLQKFVASKALDDSFLNLSTYSDSEFIEIKKILLKTINNVELR